MFATIFKSIDRLPELYKFYNMCHKVLYVYLDFCFPKQQILDSSKLKAFADDNFKFDRNDRRFFIWVENTVGKGEIACFEQFLLFLQCFQKTCDADKNQGLFGKELKL